MLLLQEACYRALGEAFSQLQALPGIVFADWYTSELRGLLQPKQVRDRSPPPPPRYPLQ